MRDMQGASETRAGPLNSVFVPFIWENTVLSLVHCSLLWVRQQALLLEERETPDLRNQEQVTGLSMEQEGEVTPKLLLQKLISEEGFWGFALIIFETFTYA